MRDMCAYEVYQRALEILGPEIMDKLANKYKILRTNDEVEKLRAANGKTRAN